MQFETERLILREYTMDDFDALYEIFSDEVTMEYYPKPFDRNKVRDWIKWNIENYEIFGFGLWAVVLKETGEMIGDCGITMQTIGGKIKPEIGYHIHKKYWNKGLGNEAARKCRDYIFENTPFNIIYSCMKYSNVGSYSVAIKNGMQKVDESEDDKNTITKVYAISRNEWLQLTK
nr:GNAT family N-acetyltransferase [uncultured Aminipila sp.]